MGAPCAPAQLLPPWSWICCNPSTDPQYPIFRVCHLTTAFTPVRYYSKALHSGCYWLPVATLDEQPVGVLGNSAVRPPPRSLREEAPSTRDKRGRRDEIWVKTLCIQRLKREHDDKVNGDKNIFQTFPDLFASLAQLVFGSSPRKLLLCPHPLVTYVLEAINRLTTTMSMTW